MMEKTKNDKEKENGRRQSKIRMGKEDKEKRKGKEVKKKFQYKHV